MVAGPIGNLEDVTLRALKTLREADLILAEDTRVTRRLLSRFDIHTPVTSLHAHSSVGKVAQLVERLLAGENLALVTDAGTPGVSDPADAMVAAAAEAGVSICPVPGPSAVTAAVAIAGIPSGKFVFEGFVPRTKKERDTLFLSLRDEPRAVVLFESPHRLRDTLSCMADLLGERKLLIAREMTKIHEEVYRGTVTGALSWLTENRLRGEFTLVLYPKSKSDAGGTDEAALEQLDAALKAAMAEGLSPREITRSVSALTGFPRRQVYERLLRFRGETDASRGEESP